MRVILQRNSGSVIHCACVRACVRGESPQPRPSFRACVKVFAQPSVGALIVIIISAPLCQLVSPV